MLYKFPSYSVQQLKVIEIEVFVVFYCFKLKNCFKFEIGKDAEQPFLVDLPEMIYKSSTFDVNTMFTINSKEIMSVVPKIPEFVLESLDANFDSPLPFYAPPVSIQSDEVCEIYFCTNKHDSVEAFFDRLVEVYPKKFVNSILTKVSSMKKQFRNFSIWAVISILSGALYKVQKHLPRIRQAKHTIPCKLNSAKSRYFPPKCHYEFNQ